MPIAHDDAQVLGMGGKFDAETAVQVAATGQLTPSTSATLQREITEKKHMSTESVEWWARSLTAWATFGAVMVAVIGAFALGFATKSGKLKDAAARVKEEASAKSEREFRLALAAAEKEIAAAKEKQANAEIKLEELRKAREPRRLNIDEFATRLKGKSRPVSVEIVFQPNDGEAAQFAQEIWMTLVAAGWAENTVDIAHMPKAISDEVLPNGLSDRDLLLIMPATARVRGKPSGVTIVSPTDGGASDSPILSLLDAFTASGFAPNSGISLGLDSSIQQNGMRIVVGPKP